MNILIKLMSIVALIIAPTLAVIHADKINANTSDGQVKTEVSNTAPQKDFSAVIPQEYRKWYPV